MWLKILSVSIVVVLVLIWWKGASGNVAYFDGVNTFQIPDVLFNKDQKDELNVSLRFPKDGVKNGIVLFMRAGANFKIVYVQDGKLVVNYNNDQDKSLVFGPDLEAKSKSQEWVRFVFDIEDEFKDTPVYFGGAPINKIPTNMLILEGQTSAVPFPENGLKAYTNYFYLNDFNLLELID